ncbi:phage tail protein [Marinobacter alexandrii]|uniref:phage tail protein n=1 Tax=Marinobacter alexandrii TaxID=2570351 RepID=UPI00200034F2|nr:phage tail protein [Marinobacter alexandrii]MCK2149540.1 phage tail protein [Marinobacter alexandrii]
MGWNPLDDIADAFRSGFEAIGDFFSDPLGAIEDIFNSTLDIMTLGAFSYAKDQIRGLFDFDIPYQDRTKLVRAPAGARQIVYGRARVGGQLVYIESWFDDRRFLTMTIVVAAHQVEEITAIYANGRQVASARASGNGRMPVVQDGKYNRAGEESRIFCWSADGTQAAAILPTVTPAGVPSNPPNWTSDHKLLGQAYVHIFCWYHEDKFESGLPKFEVELKGKNDIYDPRTGLSGYTDNQALCTLDALRWSRMLNVPDADIDMAAFSTAANIADELVASGVGTTERRYTVNGSIPFDRPPLEVISSLAKAGAGFPVYTQGQWTYVPGAYTAPVMTLDESQLIGGLSFQPGPGKSARHNKATGTYIDADQNFEVVEFSQLIIDAYIADDLEELEKTFEFALTNSGPTARRLAKISIERGRFGLTVSLVAKFKALRLTPGDRINLSIERLGWTPKVFRVEAIEFSFQSGVKLDLREDDPAIYDWAEGDVLALDPPPAIQIPDALEISPPTGIVVSEELYQTLTRAAIKVRMLVSWDADDDRVARGYDVQIRKVGAANWTDIVTFWQDNSVEINDVDDDDYEVRVRAINTLGQRSDWSQVSYTVIGKSAPPPDIPLLFVEKRILKWTYPSAPLDLAGFLVRFQNGDRQFWADATPMHEGIVTETLFDVSNFSGTKTFLVKAIDTTGNVSLNPAILVQGLGDAPVENVIQEVQEAPDWTDTTQAYSFLAKSAGVTEGFQVKSGGITEGFDVQSSASFTGAFVNANGHLEGVEIGGFYGETTSIFYSADPASDFYGAEYQSVEYKWTFEVLAADVGSSLTAEVILQNAFNQRFDYTPPNYTGDPLAFPGSIVAEQGIYQFTLAIPQQQLPSPPIVENVITRLDVGDIQERIGDVVIASGGTRLPIVRSYREIVVVNLTLQEDGGTASAIKILDKDELLGPLVQAYDDNDVAVSATIDALIQGY